MNSRILSTIVVSLSLSLLLFACAKAAPTATPTRAPTVVAVAPTATPTRAPAAAATATPTRAIVAATPTPTAIVAPTATAKRAPSGTLTIAYANLGNEVWLPRNTTQDEAPVMQVLFEGLLGYDPDTATFPSDFLAEKWSVKDTPAGGGLWSFTLRKGVQFHKGWGEITAEDFKFSITEYKKGNSTNASSSAYVEWYGDDPNNIKMLDKYSFEVNSPSRNATLARRISRTALPVMSKKYMDSVGEAGYGKNPVGTGPLDLTEHKRNEKASFKAILNHWRVTPDYAELNLVTVPEISTRIAMLRTGQIDMTAIPSRYKAELLAAGLQIFRAESASEIQQMFGGLFLTTRPKYDPSVPWAGREPLDESPTLVRKAMNLAIDRQAILDKILLGEGYLTALAFNYQKKGVFWWKDDWKPYPYDPKGAKEALTKAGYPNGFDMNAYVMVLAWEPANEAISEAVASMWEQNLGLRVKRQLTEYRPTVRQKLVERATAGYTYIFSNPGVSDPVNYGCACCIGPSWVTVLHTEHPKVDELCGPLLKELDTNKWVPGLQKLGDFLYYNYWNAPIANGNALFAAGKRVKSYTPWPQSSLMQVIEYVTLNR